MSKLNQKEKDLFNDLMRLFNELIQAHNFDKKDKFNEVVADINRKTKVKK